MVGLGGHRYHTEITVTAAKATKATNGTASLDFNLRMQPANVAAHRPGASDVRSETEALPPGSVQPPGSGVVVLPAAKILNR